MKSILKSAGRIAAAAGLGLLAVGAQAAGLLKPENGAEPFEIRSHQAQAVINNGFAMTEVEQVFFNPGAKDAEAVYVCPLPTEAALSEFAVTIDGKEIQGEVVEAQKAEKIYQEEKAAGRDAGLAKKDGFKSLEFHVSPVRAGKETRVRYVYYQPLRIDTGTGRYVYPLEEGGTDDGAKQFWTGSAAVKGTFRFNAEIKSAFPIDAVRVANPTGARVSQLDPERWKVEFEQAEGATLGSDIVFYYRLAGDLPGRLEALPYREPGSPEGTVMLVFTPGVDLTPVGNGIDWVFTLDLSGSMDSKLGSLAAAMEGALNAMTPEDRFRVVLFSDAPRELLPMLTAEPARVKEAIAQIKSLRANGSTNLFAGLDLAMKGIDADRTTGLVLVTDGVANQGPTGAAEFEGLLRGSDVRVFTAVLGNSADWPLMEIVAEASQGFCIAVSNSDDLSGRLLLARNKITHHAMTDAKIEAEGLDLHDITPARVPSLYHGQQFVMFARYSEAGTGKVALSAKIAGRPERLEMEATLPLADVESPEIERLWAMSRCDELQKEIRRGGNEAELRREIVETATRHSIVTDHTSMVVVTEQRGREIGLGRDNAERANKEVAARDQRAQQPSRNLVPPQQVASANPSKGFGVHAPRIGGGGAIDPITGLAALAAMGAGAWASRKRKKG